MKIFMTLSLLAFPSITFGATPLLNCSLTQFAHDKEVANDTKALPVEAKVSGSINLKKQKKELNLEIGDVTSRTRIGDDGRLFLQIGLGSGTGGTPQVVGIAPKGTKQLTVALQDFDRGPRFSYLLECKRQ